MSDLKPTKARLALLQAVADGAVTEHYKIRAGYVAEVDCIGAGWPVTHLGRRYLRVTARVNELYEAGLVQLVRRTPRTTWHDDQFHKFDRLWQITPRGRAVLDGVS